jgi:hypothetical protein
MTKEMMKKSRSSSASVYDGTFDKLTWARLLSFDVAPFDKLRDSEQRRTVRTVSLIFHTKSEAGDSF